MVSDELRKLFSKSPLVLFYFSFSKLDFEVFIDVANIL